MDIEEALIEEGRKFMWDGAEYESEKHAEAKRKEYEAKNFEVKTVEKGGCCRLYTRRVVAEIVSEGEAAA